MLIMAGALCAFGISGAETRDVPLYDSVPAAWTYEPQVTAVSPSDDAWWRLFDDKDMTS